MSECVFCRIINGELSAEKVYENGKMLAFLDINPVNKGHLLLIPKEHYPFMSDVPDELLGELFVRAKSLMKTLKKALEADFVVESVVGLDVSHFHIHIIPRYNGDGLANFWPTKKYAPEEIKKYADKIKSFL